MNPTSQPPPGPFLQAYQGLSPRVDPSAWVHPMATLIGEVTLAPRVSVWPGVVLRGDQGAIVIGEESNLQDGTIAHCTGALSTTTVGARVTVGHRVLLHGCTVGDDCLVGMGAILLDNCVIEPLSVVGAGALVPAGRRFPRRHRAHHPPRPRRIPAPRRALPRGAAMSDRHQRPGCFLTALPLLCLFLWIVS